MDGKPAVVMDMDVASIRAGFAGEQAPRWSATTSARMPGGPSKLTPDWGAYEGLLYQAFKNMNVSSEERPLFMVLRSSMPKTNLENVTRIAFETFSVPGFFAQNTASAVLAWQRKDTGVVVDNGVVVNNGVVVHVGAGEAQVDPVYQQRLMAHAVMLEKYADEQQLATQTYNAIMKTEPDIRSTLFGNIVLVGEIDGKIATPVKDRIKALAPSNTVVNVTVPGDPRNAAWIGASFAASIPSTVNEVIFKWEYDESSPAIVHSRWSV